MDNSTLRSSKSISLSVLDLVPVLSGREISDSFKNSLQLAQHVERLGYKRYWLAEHHNMPGIASSATPVLIGYIAQGTASIRVGSGGVMLPNHAPLIVAEQFGTLASLYPGRIDLGLGRAPGTDQLTAMALRRHLSSSVEDFPQNVQELRTYLSAENSSAKVRAVQAEGIDLPVWLLGSSTYSAQLAALLGLPFAFASHFAPAMLHASLNLYRNNFRASNDLANPYTMAGINVIAADSDEEARYLASSLYLSFLNVIKGSALPMQPPVKNLDDYCTPSERYAVEQMLSYTFIGSPQTLRGKLENFVQQTGVNELMVVSSIYEPDARMYSYQLVAELELGKT